MATRKSTATTAPPSPLDDLAAAEAIVDLVRIAVEQDFLGNHYECRQESAAVAAGHALYLVRRARLTVVGE